MVFPAYFFQQFGQPIVNMVAGFQTIISTLGAHNLSNGTLVLIQYATGITSLNGNVYPITVLGPSEFSLPVTTSGTYTGSGTYSISGYANHYLTQ